MLIVANLHEKTEYENGIFIHKKPPKKQALNHGLFWKNLHRTIKFK